MTTLLLIRHGQSTANLSNLFAGHTDAPLTELGHTQARVTARFLKETYRLDAVYSSDLCRAYETARHTAEAFGLPVQTDAGLREIFGGRWESHPFDRLALDFPEDFSTWQTDFGHCRCTGGESVLELSDRIWNTLCRIARENEGKTVAVATHATPIRVTLWKLSSLPLSKIQTIPWVSNASVTELCFSDGVMTAVKVSQDDHLAQLRSFLPPDA